MTPEERARKIAEWIKTHKDCPHDPYGKCIECLSTGIAAQIAEAEREAVKNAVMTMSNNEGVNIAFNEGFAAAQAKAVEIAQDHAKIKGPHIHKGFAFCVQEVAARLSEMKP